MGRILARVLAYVAGLTLAHRAQAADYLCCDMSQAAGTECQWAPTIPGAHSYERLASACPLASGANGYMVTLAAVSRTGGAQVGERSESAPFYGHCFTREPFQGIGNKWCQPILPHSGFEVVDSVTPETDPGWAINYYYTIHGSLFRLPDGTGCGREADCYLGSFQRVAPISPTTFTQSFGTYSCTNGYQIPSSLPGQTGFCYETLAYGFGHGFANVEIMPIRGSSPILSGIDSVVGTGDTSTFRITNAPPSKPIQWFSTLNGNVVENGVISGATNSAGEYSENRTWQFSDQGTWNRYAVIDGFASTEEDWTVAVNPPRLTFAGGFWVGSTPILTVERGQPGATGTWVTTRNGTSVQRHQPFVVDANGRATISGPSWAAGDVGNWTEQVVIGSRVSNVVSIQVQASVPVPAVPPWGLVSMSGGLMAAALFAMRKRAHVG